MGMFANKMKEKYKETKKGSLRVLFDITNFSYHLYGITNFKRGFKQCMFMFGVIVFIYNSNINTR